MTTSTSTPLATSRATRIEPAPTRRRDLVLALAPLAGLAALFSYRGDVVHPHGTDRAHPLGHLASLVHSGHVPGAVIIGVALLAVAVVGILGLLGDSPLDLRGDELAVPRDARPWWRREGTWLVALCALLYLPFAGAYGLWDPWETHYAEVAREVLARDDWITLWWGQEGWFMSKPVLIFWMTALSFSFGSTFGLPFWSDQGPHLHEWFVRVPIVLLAIAAVYALYRAVARAWGPRAGLCVGLVLTTMPHWFLIAHQGMTDMPFVAPLVIAMAFLARAVTTDPTAVAAPRAVRIAGRTLRVSQWHLTMAALVLVAAPQVTYLLTRPMRFTCGVDAPRACTAALAASRVGPIQFPIERYASGSAANSAPDDAAASVPGSPAWEDRFNQVPMLPSAVQGVIWLALAVVLLRSLRRERSQQALSFAVVYLCSAISFLGKGPAGLGVPEIVLLAFMVVTRRWRLLREIRLLQGAGIFLLCGLPWYVAIYARLGNEFIDRFVVNDLLNRAFAGVHGDTGTIRYFIGQLGYGLFPWIGLVPVALFGQRLLVPPGATDAQRAVARIGLLWFAVTFTLFSLMVTRFHHYILPAVPAAAILVGLLLHRLLGAATTARVRAPVVALGASLAGVGALVVGIAEMFGSWRGDVTASMAAHPWWGAVAIVAAMLLLALAWGLTRSMRSDDPLDLSPGTFGAVAIAAAVVLTLVARDIGWVGSARPAGFERFVHLFTYNYNRAFPTASFDYHPILTAFGIVSVLSAIALAWPRTRLHGAAMVCVLSVVFTAWSLDRYLIDLSHHWSQRDLLARYYAARRSPDDPIAAYQMNWKGENFYTGNHATMIECGLPMCSGLTLAQWLQRHRGEHGFVLTDAGRTPAVLAAVRREHGDAHAITGSRDNVMFTLIEVQL